MSEENLDEIIRKLGVFAAAARLTQRGMSLKKALKKVMENKEASKAKDFKYAKTFVEN